MCSARRISGDAPDRAFRGELGENVAAVAVVIDHRLHTVQLPDGTVEAFLHIALQLVAARRALMATATRRLLRLRHRCMPLSLDATIGPRPVRPSPRSCSYTLKGYLIIFEDYIPQKGMRNRENAIRSSEAKRRGGRCEAKRRGGRRDGCSPARISNRARTRRRARLGIAEHLEQILAITLGLGACGLATHIVPMRRDVRHAPLQRDAPARTGARNPRCPRPAMRRGCRASPP